MPALVAGIHDFTNAKKKDVDARVKPGHDDKKENFGQPWNKSGDDG